MARSRKASPRSGRTPDESSRDSLFLDREAVRYWRLQRGWTQETLAKQVATLDEEAQTISYAQIRRIESDGRCGPTSARILATLLEVSLAQLSPRDNRHLPCGLPREPSTDFVGREGEIKEVLAALRGRGSVRIAASIEGLPGIGKTELALQVCGQCEREREFRIFWIDAEQPDLSAIWSDVVAPHLGIEAQTPEERVSAAIRTIESLSEPVLLVLDNVEEWSASRPWPRPRGRHIRWLVTTRRSDLGGREFQHIDVPILQPAAAEQLMTRIAGPAIADRPGFHALLDLLGGYTIAVELAATFLRRFPEVDPAEYRAELERGVGGELEEEVGDRTSYGRTLERALELLWERLPPRIRRDWQLAAQFAQAPASAALSDACGLDRRARAALRDHCLIGSDLSRGWSMHRLVRGFGRKRADQDHFARKAFVAGCIERSRDMDVNTGYLIFNPDRAHFESVLACPRSRDDGSGPRDTLLGNVASARCSLGDYASALTLAQEARRLRNARLGECAPEAIALDRIIGWILFKSGDWKGARQLYETALESLVGQDELSIEVSVAIRSPLGVVLGLLGYGTRSKEIFEQALADARELTSPGTVIEDELRGNLAVTLRELGELEGARALLQELVADAVRKWGHEHPTTALRKNNLAGVLLYGGELDAARVLYEEALEATLASLPEHHPTVAMRRGNLAAVLRDLGDLLAAKRLFERALDDLRAAHGPHHFLVVRFRSHFAVTLRELGELDRSIAEFEWSLGWYEENLSEDHELIGGELRDLSQAYCLSGRFEEAMSAAARSAALFSQRNSSRGALAAAVQARAQLAMGRIQEADEVLRNSLSALGPGRKEPLAEATTLCELAWVARAQGQLEQASRHLSTAVALAEEAGVRARPLSAVLQARLGLVLTELGNPVAAGSRVQEARRLAAGMPAAWVHRREIEQLAAGALGGQSGTS